MKAKLEVDENWANFVKKILVLLILFISNFACGCGVQGYKIGETLA